MSIVNVEALKQNGCQLWWPGQVASSNAPKAITANGDVKQLCSPCGSGVAYFDGTGDYLTIPTTVLGQFHQSAFTLEFRFKRTAASGVAEYMYAQCNSSGTLVTCTAYVSLYSDGRVIAGICTTSGSVVSITSTVYITDTDWHSVAFVRSGNYLYLYIDGVDGTGAYDVSAYTLVTNTSDVYTIGRYGSKTSGYFNGYISDFKISNSAKYTADYTPSSQPFAPDPNTKLLLHMDGVGNAFYDSSDPPGDNGFPILPAGVTVTPSGTFTTQKMKDGRNVWVFDGSTNYITISDHASWSMFTSDFTIVAWVKFDSIAANRIIIGQYTDANNQWYVKWTTSNIIQLYGITSSTARFDFTCPLTPVAGTWYHVVIQRSGSSCVMYINGVAQTVTQTTAFSATATDIVAVLSIGKINTEYQAGNTKDLQIFTKALTMDQISALYQETYIY